LFWTISIFLLIVASLFVVIPMWKYYRSDSASEALSRTDTNLSIFEQRSHELELDLGNGNLDQEQYAALLLELKKTLLVDTEQSQAKASKSTPETVRRSSLVVPALFLFLIPVTAYVLYEQWGSLEEIEMMELYERTVNNVDDPDEALELVRSIGAVVLEDQDNYWALFFLARNFSNLAMFTEAENSFRLASELMPDGPDKAATLGQYAQIKYINSGGELTDEVLEIIGQARALNPSEFASLQLLSLDAENKGAFQDAIGYWRLMIQANPNSSQAQDLRNRIAAAQAMLAGQDGSAEGAGPRVEVNVALAEGLQLPEDLRVFVSARNAEREGLPPLAAVDLLVKDLPATVTLDNSVAVGPFNLASADTVYVSAAVSRSGSATVQSGDYRVVSQNFGHAGQHTVIDLVISEVVP
jgi:cytochrome c-type biogenesis protein CcmH